MRKILFKVVYYNDFNDRLITLFGSPSYEAAEYFATHYDGAEKEVFIKKVWALEGKYEQSTKS